MALSEEELKTWQAWIELAKRYQDQFGNQDDRWTTNVKAMAGDFDSSSSYGPEAIDVNLVHANNKTVLPPLWLTEPYVTVKPTRERITISGADTDNMRRAEVTELELNYWLRELRVRERVTRPCVLDAEASNHGYAYVGYIKKSAEVRNEDNEDTEPNPQVRLKQPFVVRVPFRDVLMPPGYWFLEECPWVAIRWLKPLKDVESRYDVTGLKPTASIIPEESRTGLQGELAQFVEGNDAKLVELYQIFDKRKRRILTLAEAHDKELKDERWDFTTEGFPLVDLSFVEVPDEYYGPPPVSFYLPQQRELNAIRTSMRKRFNRTKSIILGAADLGEDVSDAYQDAKDGDWIKTNVQGDEDIRRKIFELSGLQQDQGTLIYQQQIMRDMMQITGASAEQRGAADPNVSTATSSQNIEMHVQVRSSDRADRVKTFYLDIARKLWMVLKQFPNEERERLVAGAVAGQFTTVTYSLEELEGEFAFELDLSVGLSENPATRQALALANYNLLRADPLANPEQLILDVLRSQNKPNPEQYLLSLREPDDELKLMVQGLPVEPHERDNHEQHEQAHEGQASEVEAALERVDPTSDMGRKLRFTLALLLAHQNAHAQMRMAITGQQGRQAGSPVSENLFRNQQRSVSGVETQAELTGQPLLGAG